MQAEVLFSDVCFFNLSCGDVTASCTILVFFSLNILERQGAETVLISVITSQV